MKECWNTKDFERRLYACGTCKRALKVCPDCGQPLGFEHPETKIFCKEHNVEAVEAGLHSEPGEMMGGDGVYQSQIYECPVCHRKCCPSQEKLEEVYTNKSEKASSYEVVARDGSRYKNIGFYIDSGT